MAESKHVPRHLVHHKKAQFIEKPEEYAEAIRCSLRILPENVGLAN
jgi:hypothetical protein